jgi:phosphoglycerol transferase MdoB-like AlkP superfamily enzyme
MKNNVFIHTAIALLISFFALVLADLIPFWMPMMGEMTVLLIATVLLIVWVGFILFETVHDEREAMLRHQSGRFAYLAGISVLLCALVVQGFAHAIDPWIPVTLAVMVVVKQAVRLYLE